MDYHAIHGHDISSFSLSSTHRLPTISAALALEDLDTNPSRYIVSTGLASLDKLLSKPVSGVDQADPNVGGVRKGQVTEIWGPPGSGKTSLGIHLAAGVLREGNRAMWTAFIGMGSPDETRSEDLTLFDHYLCPSLPHLIALLGRPTNLCVTQGTSLVVIDSLSALLNHSFPRTVEPKAGNNTARASSLGSLPARRLQVLQYIIGALQKLAASHELAVVVLTQSATRMQAERSASLIPAINANVWEQGVSTRLVLFRDWAIHQHGQATSLHFAGVQKVDGKSSDGSIRGIVAFKIESAGLCAVTFDSSQQPVVALSATLARKRKLGDTDFEVPDSDDEEEDYGWRQYEEMDAMPPPPSQWQGSEDVLLGVQPESGDDEYQDDDHQLEEEPPSPETEGDSGTPEKLQDNAENVES